jgi:hypothetical protein
VLADAECPATDAGVAGVVNPGRDLAHELVPAGRPRAGLVAQADRRGRSGESGLPSGAELQTRGAVNA